MVIKMVINWVMIHMELMNQWMEWELYPIFRHTDILSGFRRSSLKNFRRRKAILLSVSHVLPSQESQ